MPFKTLFTFRKTYVIYRDSTKANYIKRANRVIMHLCQVNKIGQYYCEIQESLNDLNLLSYPIIHNFLNFFVEYIMRSQLARLTPLHSENVDLREIPNGTKLSNFMNYY